MIRKRQIASDQLHRAKSRDLAVPVPFCHPDRVQRATTQRLVTLALAVLNRAAYDSQTRRTDTIEVRLALAVLWCILRRHDWLSAYWARATEPTGCPWQSCREPWYGIAHDLRAEGWHAPVSEVQPNDDTI